MSINRFLHIIRVVFCVFVVAFSTTQRCYAQKVGLVLSGGGAKGCTHIGIIRALEENGIPIDYIAGTSIGAVIGSLYSMGYTPDEMEALLSSDEFQTWKSGRLDEKSIYYYKKETPTPEFITLKADLDSPFNFKQGLFPKSLIKPTQINIAFVQLFAQASAACKGDFNKLMVPFRSVSADVNAKETYVHKKGDLGDAVRASMSFPLVFNPVDLDGRLLYDGGVYNNFPVNVMQSEFKPDYLIGVSVGDEVTVTDSKSNLVEQIENLILDRNEEYQNSPDSMLILNFKFKDIGLLDFGKIHELSRIGYDSMSAHINDIRSVVHTYISIDSIAKKRTSFKDELAPLYFKNVWINGGTPMQRNYIRRNIGGKEDGKFSFPTFKKNYYKLMSDSKIEEILPHTAFNEKDSTFDLNLDLKVDNNIKLSFGGFLSSTNVNQFYMGLSYQNFFVLPVKMVLDGQVGAFYKGASLRTRSDLIGKFPMYFNLNVVSHSFSYYNEDVISLVPTNTVYRYSSDETYARLKFGFPFMRTGKMEFGAAAGINNLREKGYYTPAGNNFDKIKKHQINISSLFDRSTFTVRQYPILGSLDRIAFNYLIGREQASFYDETGVRNDYPETSVYMLQASWLDERFFKLSKHFIVGTYAEYVFSSEMWSLNGDLAILPAFQPTIHSKTNYNPYLRYPVFVGVGVLPIFKINDQLHLRFENYLFQPITYGYYKDGYFMDDHMSIGTVYLSELNMVLQFNFLTISAYGNYYSKPKNDWNVGLNLGFALFNDRFIER